MNFDIYFSFNMHATRHHLRIYVIKTSFEDLFGIHIYVGADSYPTFKNAQRSPGKEYVSALWSVFHDVLFSEVLFSEVLQKDSRVCFIIFQAKEWTTFKNNNNNNNNSDVEKKIKEKFEPLLWSGTTCLFHGKVELNDVTQDGGASKRAAHPRGRR